jgi:hypothetical protein
VDPPDRQQAIAPSGTPAHATGSSIRPTVSGSAFITPHGPCGGRADPVAEPDAAPRGLRVML